MRKKHLVTLKGMIQSSLEAHKMADWSSEVARNTVAGMIMVKFSKYMKDQENLESTGLTEEDCMIPPGGLGQEK